MLAHDGGVDAAELSDREQVDATPGGRLRDVAEAGDGLVQLAQGGRELQAGGLTPAQAAAERVDRIDGQAWDQKPDVASTHRREPHVVRFASYADRTK